MSRKKSGAKTAQAAWSTAGHHPGSEARWSGDSYRPFYGTRLGLERIALSDGRSLVAGRLTGRRVG